MVMAEIWCLLHGRITELKNSIIAVKSFLSSLSKFFSVYEDII